MSIAISSPMRFRRSASKLAGRGGWVSRFNFLNPYGALLLRRLHEFFPFLSQHLNGVIHIGHRGICQRHIVFA